MLDKLGISCTLLTSSMTAAQKRAALAAIETGAAQVVVARARSFSRVCSSTGLVPLSRMSSIGSVWRSVPR